MDSSRTTEVKVMAQDMAAYLHENDWHVVRVKVNQDHPFPKPPKEIAPEASDVIGKALESCMIGDVPDMALGVYNIMRLDGWTLVKGKD